MLWQRYSQHHLEVMFLIFLEVDGPQIGPARPLLVVLLVHIVAYLSKLLDTYGIILLSTILDHVAEVLLLYRRIWLSLYFAELRVARDVRVGLSIFLYLLDGPSGLLCNGLISIHLLLLFLGKVLVDHVVVLLGHRRSHTWRGNNALFLIVGLVREIV